MSMTISCNGPESSQTYTSGLKLEPNFGRRGAGEDDLCSKMSFKIGLALPRPLINLRSGLTAKLILIASSSKNGYINSLLFAMKNAELWDTR